MNPVSFANPIRPQQKGYIYIWVSNESENTKVWFDDLKVTHRSRRVTQATDYYAYGSVLWEQKTPEELTYRYKYQGQYAEKDEETVWSHFEAREYDPVVGRWTTTDPYGQYYSLYIGMGNNPINGVDPDGGYSKFGAQMRTGFGLFGRVYQSDNDGGNEVWGFYRNGAHYFGKDARNNFTDTPSLRAVVPNIFGRTENLINDQSGAVKIGGQILYGIVDDVYVSFLQINHDRKHLNGYVAWPNEVTEAGANTLTNFFPASKGAKILNIGKKTLNAGQFNKLFKGTSLVKGPHKLRGQAKKNYNYVIKEAESARTSKNIIDIFMNALPLFNGNN